MSRRLVIEPTGFGLRGAVLEDARLIDVIDIDDGGGSVTDALFIARVRTIDAKLNAAFVDIGQDSHAFLNAKDARHRTGDFEKRPISRLLNEGASLIVQGVREGEAGKGARVTSDIKLFGFFLIYRPFGNPPEALGPARGRERAHLKERGQALFADEGVVLRKQSSAVSDESLRAELDRLKARWAQIEALAARTARPGRIAAVEPAAEALLRAVMSPQLEAIEVADTALLAAVKGLLDGPLRQAGPALERLDAGRPAFAQTGVAEAIEEALRSEVPLERGGRLIFEDTAALMAVDVDGGGRPAIEADLDAAFELARQLRLRNVGGTIVVDFVDLPTKALRQRLEGALTRAFRDDPVTVQIYPVSQLGLVQISRARRGRTLKARLTRPCHACGGEGSEPSLRACSERLFAALAAGTGTGSVRVAADLAIYLSSPDAATLKGRLDTLARLETDPALPPGGFTLP